MPRTNPEPSELRDMLRSNLLFDFPDDSLRGAVERDHDLDHIVSRANLQDLRGDAFRERFIAAVEKEEDVAAVMAFLDRNCSDVIDEYRCPRRAGTRRRARRWLIGSLETVFGSRSMVRTLVLLACAFFLGRRSVKADGTSIDEHTALPSASNRPYMLPKRRATRATVKKSRTVTRSRPNTLMSRPAEERSPPAPLPVVATGPPTVADIELASATRPSAPPSRELRNVFGANEGWCDRVTGQYPVRLRGQCGPANGAVVVLLPGRDYGSLGPPRTHHYARASTTTVFIAELDNTWTESFATEIADLIVKLTNRGPVAGLGYSIGAVALADVLTRVGPIAHPHRLGALFLAPAAETSQWTHPLSANEVWAENWSASMDRRAGTLLDQLRAVGHVELVTGTRDVLVRSGPPLELGAWLDGEREEADGAYSTVEATHLGLRRPKFVLPMLDRILSNLET
jgi:hypothetical protein